MTLAFSVFPPLDFWIPLAILQAGLFNCGSSPKKLVVIEGFKGSSEMIKNHKELKVWQQSYRLCLEVYRVTKGFPKEELYGLTSLFRK